MDNLGRYILVSDNCEHCTYTTNAFTLMRWPLLTLSVRNIIENEDDFPHTACFLLCKNIETEQGELLYKRLSASKAHLISFTDRAKAVEKTVHYLKPEFSQYELTETLALLNHPEDTDKVDFKKLIGRSAHISKIRSMIKQVANSDSTVLILGQSGTGKDVIASCLHHASTRNEHAFVPINCGAIPSELIESELFGHEKGAFTGALTRRPGRFEMAHAGTLFLDEIGDMPMPMQVKLLRVIQDRSIERVGGNASIKVDVRLIAATNKNLDELIKQNKFREDLFYRLNVFPINVPSLSERSEDIPDLMDYHLNRIHDRLKHRVEFTERAKAVLCEYPWPGNIRELENFLERMVILHRDQVLDEKDIDAAYKKKSSPASLPLDTDQPFNIKEYIANAERQMIQFALDRSNGLVNAAAEYLSLGKSALLEKMKKYDLVSAEEESVG